MATIARAPIAVLPNATMSQSGIMVGALLAGFVVYLAMTGKLAAYWGILMGGGASATATPTTGATSPTTSTSPATSGSTSTSSTATTTSPFGLPSSAFPSLGGTANPFAAATGGVGSTSGATGGAAIGVPNTSFGQFMGLS